MTFTPTTKGSFLAGIGLWLMLWLGLFKLDEIVRDTHLRRLVSSEGCVRWISKHRSTTLLGTELFNYSTHGISNPDGVHRQVLTQTSHDSLSSPTSHPPRSLTA